MEGRTPGVKLPEPTFAFFPPPPSSSSRHLSFFPLPFLLFSPFLLPLLLLPLFFPPLRFPRVLRTIATSVPATDALVVCDQKIQKRSEEEERKNDGRSQKERKK